MATLSASILLFAIPELWVPVDKNEGGVRGIVLLGSAEAPLFSPERLRTKTLESHLPNYTMDMNCATAALSITRKVGLTLPTA